MTNRGHAYRDKFRFRRHAATAPVLCSRNDRDEFVIASIVNRSRAARLDFLLRGLSSNFVSIVLALSIFFLIFREVYSKSCHRDNFKGKFNSRFLLFIYINICMKSNVQLYKKYKPLILKYVRRYGLILIAFGVDAAKSISIPLLLN